MSIPQAGLEYKKACAQQRIAAIYEPGVHFKATEDDDNILLPDLPGLRGLRHKWCWVRRRRLHLPTWSYAKVPRDIFSVEENARMLCVYMRPWSLNPQECSSMNPLLSSLGKVFIVDGEEFPAWLWTREAAEKYKRGDEGATTGDASDSNKECAPYLEWENH